MSEETKITRGVTFDTKIWFINRLSGKVGSRQAMVKRSPGKNGKDIVEITYITTMQEAKQVDIYFNEEEWLSDIKKL